MEKGRGVRHEDAKGAKGKGKGNEGIEGTEGTEVKRRGRGVNHGWHG
jgi:hypothetical protein